MAKTVARLSQYWSQWSAGLTAIADKRGCRIAMPQLTSHNDNSIEQGAIRIGLAHPICLLNAPPKGSSHVSSSSSKRLTIFIDGQLFISAGEPARLLHSACSISFFQHEPTGDTSEFKARLVDTAHFDMEKLDNVSAFHPVLHAQRGFRTDNLERCKQAIAAAGRDIDVQKIVLDYEDVPDLVRNPYLRLPTPQLDVFSVSTIIAADYFCSEGHNRQDPGVKTRFQHLLTLLAGDRNFTRAGGMSQRLFGRFQQSGYACVAHWYEEYPMLN